ncbi:MAG: hypothetical protein PHY47_05300 [Lachnospiraceae bacterium]|nr:hypothetical protein [Lachnospiraceae bacterium]
MALVNNQMALNTVYNTFLTTYALKTDTKYDAHKKSELKNIYNSILKQNKEAPLYLYKSKKETQEFAVGLKENARQLKNTISSLSSQDATSFLDKKVAYSTNPDSINVKYIAESNIEDL